MRFFEILFELIRVFTVGNRAQLTGLEGEFFFFFQLVRGEGKTSQGEAHPAQAIILRGRLIRVGYFTVDLALEGNGSEYDGGVDTVRIAGLLRLIDGVTIYRESQDGPISGTGIWRPISGAEYACLGSEE